MQSSIYTSRVIPSSQTLRLSDDSRSISVVSDDRFLRLANHQTTISIIPSTQYVVLESNQTYVRLGPIIQEIDIYIFDDGYYMYTDANDQLRIDPL